jgi:hypothetical protein
VIHPDLFWKHKQLYRMDYPAGGIYWAENFFSFPHPSRLRRATFPQREGFLFPELKAMYLICQDGTPVY